MKKIILLFLLLVLIGDVHAQQIIVHADSVYCESSTAQLSYDISGTFNSGNIFTAQLSDSTGSFANPENIGSVNSATAGSMTITIPSGIAVGSNYRIRLLSSNPFDTSLIVNIKIGIFSSLMVSNDTTICSGSFVQLHASGGSTYSWVPGATLNDSTSANPYAAPIVSQTYTVTATGNYCSSVKTVVITVNPVETITVSPTDTAVCSGMPIALHASGATSYSWSPGIGLSDTTIAGPIAILNSSTFYSVTGDECSNTAIVVINIGNTARGGNISVVNDTVCAGSSATLTLNGNSQGVIQWQSSVDGLNFSDIVGATKLTCNTGPLPISHWYEAIVGSGNCSAKSDSLMIYVPPAPIASFIATTAGEQVFFNANASANADLYSWDFGDNSFGSGGNASHTYSSFGNYRVCLVVTSYNGYCQDTICRDVNVSPTASCQAYFSLHPDPNNLHHWFALNQSIGKNPAQYIWNWGDGSISAGDSASHTYAVEGYYSICLTMNDDTMCTSTYCDSSVYLYRRDGENAVVKVNVVSSLPNAIPMVASQKNNRLIFPNPCAICQIKSADEANNFVVTDLLGRITEVSFVKSSGGYTLNFADNRTGMFLLKNIKTGEVVKFVRE